MTDIGRPCRTCRESHEEGPETLDDVLNGQAARSSEPRPAGSPDTGTAIAARATPGYAVRASEDERRARPISAACGW